jgi:hypothetical protein
MGQYVGETYSIACALVSSHYCDVIVVNEFQISSNFASSIKVTFCLYIVGNDMEMLFVVLF